MSEPRIPDYKNTPNFLKRSPYQNPQSFTMTPAALRARQPFFWKNMIAAGALMGLCGGIYWYTYTAIRGDNDFDDIPVPPISDKELERLKRERDQQQKQQQK